MGDCERLRSLVILLKGLCLCFEGKTFHAVEVFDELSVSSLGSKPQGTRHSNDCCDFSSCAAFADSRSLQLNSKQPDTEGC
ncbi:hypothetical protein WN943_018778 [Citrus x changshan-huyou]